MSVANLWQLSAGSSGLQLSTVLIKQTVLPLFVVLLEVLEYANKDNNPQVAIKKQKLESCLLS